MLFLYWIKSFVFLLKKTLGFEENNPPSSAIKDRLDDLWDV